MHGSFFSAFQQLAQACIYWPLGHSRVRMSSFNLTSTATFEARAAEIGFTEAEINRLREKQWNTFGRLAFACNYIPGTADETSLMKLAATITGTEPEDVPDARLPLVRMIFFESYTLAAADLRGRLERLSLIHI